MPNGISATVYTHNSLHIKQRKEYFLISQHKNPLESAYGFNSYRMIRCTYWHLFDINFETRKNYTWVRWSPESVRKLQSSVVKYLKKHDPHSQHIERISTRRRERLPLFMITSNSGNNFENDCKTIVSENHLILSLPQPQTLTTHNLNGRPIPNPRIYHIPNMNP